MPQIRESRFRVLDINREDLHLSDLEEGPPVYIETEHESYNEDLKNEIGEIEPGNLIEAEVRSDSLAHSDDFWTFLSVDIQDRTRFYFIDRVNNHPNIVEDLKKHLEGIDHNSARKFISSSGNRIGYITVAEAQDGKLWTGLRAGTRSHELDLQNLTNIDDPPHEIVYTRTPDEKHLVFYHIATRDTKLAKSVREANQ